MSEYDKSLRSAIWRLEETLRMEFNLHQRAALLKFFEEHDKTIRQDTIRETKED
jgi:hypothetical protein